MQDYKVIRKGKYTRPQSGLPVKITDYIIASSDGAKYLLLKFKNEREERLTRLRLKITMLDMKGREIGKTTVDTANVGGAEFVLNEGIAIDDKCVSFTAELQAAEYGNYVYKQERGGVAEDFVADASDDAQNTERLKAKLGDRKVVVKQRGFKIPLIICIFACVLFICAITFTCLQLGKFKQSEHTFLHSGVEYAFVDDDRSDGSGLIVKGYKGRNGNLVIPEEISGHPVLAVGEYAFENNGKIKSVKIEGETEIREGAFEGCANLATADIAGVKVIGNSAFKDCVSLTDFYSTSVESIDFGAFWGCTSLKSVTITESKTKLRIVDAVPFLECTALESVDIGCEIVYTQANSFLFSRCFNVQSLKLVNFPSFHTTIGQLFVDPSNTKLALKEIYISKFETIPAGLCANLRNLESFSTDEVTDGIICNNAFSSCTKLTKLKLPKGIKSVGESAFASTKITSFDGSALESIGTGAFKNCSELTELNITEQTPLKNLGEYAFENCVKLTSFTVPSGVENIEGVFNGCTNLLSVNFAADGKLSAIGSYAFGGCEKLSSIQINSKVTSVGAYAFSGCAALTGVVLPDGLKTLGGHSFEGCAGIVGITIPNGVTDIPESAFENCTSLSSITMPTVTTIGTAAFKNTAFTSLNLTSSITSVGRDAFGGCDKLTELTLSFIGGGTPGTEFLGYIFGATSPYDTGYIPSSIKKITLNTLTEIGSNAFYGCRGLNQITIPDTVSYVSTNAFDGCYRLFEIRNLSRAFVYCPYALAVYDNATEEMPKVSGSGYTFAYAPAYDKWYMIDSPEETQLVFPSAFVYKGTYIADYAIPKYFFYEFDLQSVTLPQAVTEIGDYAFYNCTSLKNINADGSRNLSIGAFAFDMCGSLKTVSLYGNISLGDYAFADCSSLDTFSVQGSYLTVGYGAFDYCTKLKSFYSYNTTSIDAYAFSNCESLTDFYAGAGRGAIGAYAFSGCSSLENITLAEGFTSVGECAFGYCEKLAKITLPRTLNFIDTYAFLNCRKLRVVVNYSSLYITAGSDSYGNVAKYAVAVPTNAYDASDVEYITLYGITYLRYKTQWWAVDCIDNAQGMVLSSFEYDGNLVDEIAIAPYAFEGRNTLKTITLGNGVTSVGDGAFKDCRGITSVIISGSVSKIGSYAFAGCVSLEEINLPDAVSSIGAYAFYNCTVLKEITLPAQLRYIEEATFFGCTSLGDVYLPAGLYSIGSDAFYNCYSLYQVHNLSRYLTLTVGSTGNGYCAYYALKVFNNSNQHLDFAEADGARFVKYDGNWYLYSVDSYYLYAELPQSFTFDSLTVKSYVIRRGALANYTTALIPASVTAIESGAFSSSYGTIYYGGTQSQWLSIRPYDLQNYKIYYYADCVHEDGQWTYDDYGRVSTAIRTFVWSQTTPPSCGQYGVMTGTCRECGMTVTETLEKLTHSANANGKCLNCGKQGTLVTQNNFGVLSFLSNDTVYPFEIDANGTICSTNHGNYSSSSLTVTATSDMTVCFTVRASSESGYDKLAVSLNGINDATLSGVQTATLTYALTAGDRLRFTYSKDGSGSSYDDCAYITGLTVFFD